MPVAVILPKFGFTLESAEIVKWLAQEGDQVRAGDPICEVTTDKVNMEVEAPEDGTLFRFLYQEGDTVPVTETIAYLLSPGEEEPQDFPASPVKEPAAAPPAANTPAQDNGKAGKAITPVAQRLADSAQIDTGAIQGTGPKARITRRDVEAALQVPGGKIRATPNARRLARESGVQLESVVGSGARGRIQGEDVEAFLAKTPAALERPPISGQQLAHGEDVARVVRLEGMRRTIAERMQASFQTAPHIFFDARIDMTAIDSLRQKIKAIGERLSVTAVLVKACAAVLARHPWLNATLNGDEITLWDAANIGVAVALEEGLIVPVIHHAGQRSLKEIAGQVDTLAQTARGGKLRPDDVMNGTFTISNLGMFGVDRFTAIINPPQVAILAVGAAQRQFVPDENDRPVLKSFMTITLSADHRVVDGAQAARFLADLRTVLEEPALLVW